MNHLLPHMTNQQYIWAHHLRAQQHHTLSTTDISERTEKNDLTRQQGHWPPLVRCPLFLFPGLPSTGPRNLEPTPFSLAARLLAHTPRSTFSSCVLREYPSFRNSFFFFAETHDAATTLRSFPSVGSIPPLSFYSRSKYSLQLPLTLPGVRSRAAADLSGEEWGGRDLCSEEMCGGACGRACEGKCFFRVLTMGAGTHSRSGRRSPVIGKRGT